MADVDNGGMLRPGARSWRAVAALLVLIGGIGWIDYVTGPRLSFSLFYLLPVIAAGWWLGSRPAAVLAVGAGICWLIGDEAIRPDATLGQMSWNFFTRLVIFTAMGQLTSRVRGGRDHLAALLARERLQARVDPMTDLTNSRGFAERLLIEASRSRRADRPLCLAYLDIDNFKAVNDRYGHAAGDELLRRIGGAVKETIRAGDVPGRLGGDEFAILFWDVEVGAVEPITQRIIDRIREVGAEYPEARLGASAGIVWFERAPESAEEILREADRAMYEAKSSGKGRLIVRRASAGQPGTVAAATPEPPAA